MGTSKIIVTSQVLSTMDEEICKGDQLHAKLCSRAGCFLDESSQFGWIEMEGVDVSHDVPKCSKFVEYCYCGRGEYCRPHIRHIGGHLL